VPVGSEFAVTKRILPESSVLGPYPDIQIEERK
jgi:hypothetical protein